MDHAYGYGGVWSGAIFWLFIAAIVLAGTWEKIRRNAERHETLRRIIEKTGTVDEAKLKEVFNAPSRDWGSLAPGAGYRALRIAGIIVMSVAAGLAVLFLSLGQTSAIPPVAQVIGLSVAGGVAMLGIGLFFSSRFAEPPPDRKDGPPAR